MGSGFRVRIRLRVRAEVRVSVRVRGSKLGPPPGNSSLRALE